MLIELLNVLTVEVEIQTYTGDKIVWNNIYMYTHTQRSKIKPEKCE